MEIEVIKYFLFFVVDKTIHLSIPAAGEEGCSFVEMEAIYLSFNIS